jgi:hypothetical protein
MEVAAKVEGAAIFIQEEFKERGKGQSRERVKKNIRLKMNLCFRCDRRLASFGHLVPVRRLILFRIIFGSDVHLFIANVCG